MKTRQIDYILLGTALALLLLGILLLSSVSAYVSQNNFGTPYYFLIHQLLYGFLPGLILIILILRISLETIKRWAPFLLAANLILAAMVFLPKIGSKHGGGTRWLDLGFISFQPSEFLKLTFILYLASWLAGRTFRQKFKGMSPEKKFSSTLIAFLLITGLISLILYFQSDISTLGIIILSGVLMYFASGTPLWHTILIILTGIGGLISFIKLAPYRLDRLSVFLNPGTDPMGKGFQIKQALIAVGSGGIFGLGLGMSRQKFGFLPQSMNDSIFAVFSEEIGFLGAVILIALFLIFFWRGIRIAKNATDKFSRFAALGISFWIIFQTFVNMSSMIGVFPLSGVPLPFFSYGGSHFIAEMASLGILLKISEIKYH